MLKLLRINNIALIPALEVELGPGLDPAHRRDRGRQVDPDRRARACSWASGPRRTSSARARSGRRSRPSSRSRARRRSSRSAGSARTGTRWSIRRELQSNGKGRATVNGALVPVSLLRDLAPRLTVIHGQHEPQGLLDPSTHLDLLDHFAGADDGRPLAEFFRDLRAAEAALERLRGDRRETERRREMLEFQANEIERGRPRGGRGGGAAASRRRGRPTPAASPPSAARPTRLLYDDEAAALSRLGQVFRRVEDLAAIDPSFRPFLEAPGGRARAARGPGAAAARLPRAARGQPRAPGRDRGPPGHPRAAQEEVRCHGRRGPGLRPALPP